ncbi:MarR family winged helix-turn-helix transcriptional regulator [uncultured Amnibacterium sp.]|uniref:MarR family winged helix-turn-helix transcriptional regulator n=1 Tax=uncultured Amnibacterium sp. TaxID=1631851 RepID=UPI0035CC57F0
MSGTHRDSDRPSPSTALQLSSLCGHLIRRCERIHTGIWLDEIGESVTSVQYGVLAALDDRPGIDQRLLSEIVALDKSSTADVVARLMRARWITRRRNADDGRRYELALTPAARAAFAQLVPEVGRVQDRLLEAVADGDRGDLLRGLRLIAGGAGAVGSPRADRRRSAPDVDYAATEVAALDVPGHHIRRAQQAHTAIWKAEFGRELTGPQYAVLHVLARSPHINQGTTCLLAAVDKSTGADIVDRLVRQGRIVRHRDPDDGRGNVLSLTDDAIRLAEQASPRVEAVQHRLLAPITVSDRDEFVRLLQRVAYAGMALDAFL